MPEPDWDRWHELLGIRDGRGFTFTEYGEYKRFLPIVAELDAVEVLIANMAIRKSLRAARHEKNLRRLTRLVARR